RRLRTATCSDRARDDGIDLRRSDFARRTATGCDQLTSDTKLRSSLQLSGLRSPHLLRGAWAGDERLVRGGEHANGARLLPLQLFANQDSRGSRPGNTEQSEWPALWQRR